MTWLDCLLGEGAPRTDAFLDALCAGLPPDDALALREERAGILEHLAGLDRAEAERRAGLGRPPPIKRTAETTNLNRTKKGN